MDIALFPVFGLGLVMKHGMEMKRTLFTVTAAAKSSRWTLFVGLVGMETAAYRPRTHILMPLMPTSMIGRWLMRMVMHTDGDTYR